MLKVSEYLDEIAKLSVDIQKQSGPKLVEFTKKIGEDERVK